MRFIFLLLFRTPSQNLPKPTGVFSLISPRSGPDCRRGTLPAEQVQRVPQPKLSLLLPLRAPPWPGAASQPSSWPPSHLSSSQTLLPSHTSKLLFPHFQPLHSFFSHTGDGFAGDGAFSKITHTAQEHPELQLLLWTWWTINCSSNYSVRHWETCPKRVSSTISLPEWSYSS